MKKLVYPMIVALSVLLVACGASPKEKDKKALEVYDKIGIVDSLSVVDNEDYKAKDNESTIGDVKKQLEDVKEDSEDGTYSVIGKVEDRVILAGSTIKGDKAPVTVKMITGITGSKKELSEKTANEMKGKKFSDFKEEYGEPATRGYMKVMGLEVELYGWKASDKKQTFVFFSQGKAEEVQSVDTDGDDADMKNFLK